MIIEFINEEDFSPVSAEACAAVNLELGASVSDYLKLSTDQYYYIYAEKDVALELCRLPKNVRVKARAVTVFGVEKRVEWWEDGSIIVREQVTGLLVKEIHQIDGIEDERGS